jgi:hypothetical protein
VVPADSIRVSRVRIYSGTGPRSRSSFAYGALTPYGRTFQSVRLPVRFVTPSATLRRDHNRSYNPAYATPAGFHVNGLGYLPFRSPLLRESRISFLSSGYSDVSFPRVPSSHPMCSGAGDGPLRPPGFPIRRSVLHSPLAAPHGLSQLATSFIGFRCQGIHHTPLLS